MRWQGRRQSENVEDRRGVPVRGMVAGGGIGTLLIIVVVALLGGDPRMLLQQQGPQPAELAPEEQAAQDELRDFVAVVLADTEDVWQELLARQLNTAYREPTLVLFTGQVQSGCGFASAEVGPFYCPADGKVYLDLQFFSDLRRRFGAPGDFAMAYVVAHEVGHHVQNLLGVSDRVQAARQRADEVEANRLSVRLELQADFLAGVWAHHAERMKQILEPGDLQEALAAASAVGDDRLQKAAQGYAVPDSFTHGSSQQREKWFRLGFETGDLRMLEQLFEQPFEAL